MAFMVKKTPKSWQRPMFTPEDKLLAAKLAAPDVDEKFANEHIKATTAVIQAEWSDYERTQRRISKELPVDITCKTGDHWVNGQKGLRK